MQQIEFTSLGIHAFVGALAITVCLTLPGAIAADQANSPLLAGLAAQYTFSGNANDDSGNGHHGQVMGATLTADRFGNQNSAYHFDGVDDYIRIGHPIKQALPYSWSLWIRPQSDHSTGQSWIFMTQGGEPHSGAANGTIEVDANRVVHFSEYHPWDGGLHVVYTMPSFVSTHWYHVVATADRSGRYALYIDGSLVSVMQFPACLVEDGCPYYVMPYVYIGGNPPGTPCMFPGDIDDIHMFNRALSADEVAALWAFTGDPNQPPLIWAQPASQSVLSGDVLTLRAMAFGEQPCSYQWQLGGVDLQDDARTSGATSSTLQISAVTSADAGAYTVVVSNAHGSVTSKPAILTVLLRPPEITAEPENQTLVSGVPAIFRVSAVGSLPMAYQWHRNGVELTDDGRITGTKSETLNISAVGVTDIGVYTVVISNAYGSVTGRPATLSVLLQPPQLLTEAEDQTVMSGSPVAFSVTATGSLPLGYQWQRNGVDVVDDGRIVGAKAPTLTIADVRPDDLGLYTVVVRNAYGWIVSFPAELNVILAPPAITTQPDAVTMALGSTVSLTVEAIGSLPLSYQWQRDGVDVTDGPRIAGAQTSTLTITNLEFGDLGAYAAVVSNSLGQVVSRTMMVETFSVMLHIRREGPNAVLWWNPSGKRMKLQKATQLSKPDWQDIPGTESVTSVTIPRTDAATAFFRLWSDTLRFFDDFEAGPSKSWSNETGAWTVRDRTYLATEPNHSPAAVSALPFTLTDCSVEFDVSGAGNGGVWLRSFPVPGTPIGRKGVLLVFKEQRLYWNIVPDGTSYHGHVAETGYLFDWGASIHLRVEVVGNSYTAYFGGAREAATSVVTPLFSSGQVGLYSCDQQAYDNFSLSGTLHP